MLINCVQCGKPVEHTREVYAIPTCYACLPPPAPLSVIADPRKKGMGIIAENTPCIECGEMPELARAMPRSALVHMCKDADLKSRTLWSYAEWIARNKPEESK